MLELKNISFDVPQGDGEKGILKNVSVKIDDKKFVAITGPNGGGKSTLAKIIAGIYRPTEGQIIFDGQDITDMSITDRAKAGISFEYVDFVTSSYQQMNSSSTNSGGWAATALRTTLNGTVYDSLSIKNYIKAVNKQYLADYSSSTESTSSDKLWLLSCGEIWDNGYNGGNTRGYSRSTEGSQYKYYKSTLGSTAYNTSTNITKKPNASNSYYWWLRSPSYNGSYYFCIVNSSGRCNSYDAGIDNGVAPGFSI